MLAAGLFADKDPVENLTEGRAGLFHGGGPYLLGVQLLACVCIIAWSGVITFILLYVSFSCFSSYVKYNLRKII